MALIHEIEATPSRHAMVSGFVRASPWELQSRPSKLVNPQRYDGGRRKIGIGSSFDVVEENGQFFVVDKKGTAVTPPVAAAFISYGQAKQLQNGQPVQVVEGAPTGAKKSFTEEGESAKETEEEKEKKAEDKLEELCRSSVDAESFCTFCGKPCKKKTEEDVEQWCDSCRQHKEHT
jgi:hypothetical protein